MEHNNWELRWSEALSVGVPQMDEEHREFIAQVNALTQAVLDCRDRTTIRARMDAMLAQATNHFRDEEQLLLDSGYPDWAGHVEKHLQLTARLGRVKREFEIPAISFMGALKGLQLNQLLIEHLLGEDMKYRDFLKARAECAQCAERPAADNLDRLMRERSPWSWPRASAGA